MQRITLFRNVHDGRCMRYREQTSACMVHRYVYRYRNAIKKYAMYIDGNITARTISRNSEKIQSMNWTSSSMAIQSDALSSLDSPCGHRLLFIYKSSRGKISWSNYTSPFPAWKKIEKPHITRTELKPYKRK